MKQLHPNKVMELTINRHRKPIVVYKNRKEDLIYMSRIEDSRRDIELFIE